MRAIRATIPFPRDSAMAWIAIAYSRCSVYLRYSRCRSPEKGQLENREHEMKKARNVTENGVILAASAARKEGRRCLLESRCDARCCAAFSLIFRPQERERERERYEGRDIAFLQIFIILNAVALRSRSVIVVSGDEYSYDCNDNASRY